MYIGTSPHAGVPSECLSNQARTCRRLGQIDHRIRRLPQGIRRHRDSPIISNDRKKGVDEILDRSCEVVELVPRTMNENIGVFLQPHAFHRFNESRGVIFLCVEPSLDPSTKAINKQILGTNPQPFLDPIPDITFKIHKLDCRNGLLPNCKSLSIGL